MSEDIPKPNAPPETAERSAGSNATLPAADATRPPEDAAAATDPPMASAQPYVPPAGTWTKRRLIALAPEGPLLLDLSVSVGRSSLDESSQHILEALANELLSDLEPPVTWEQLLELPLIRSGWLGNLIPDQEQRAQLISMYDTQPDGMVEAAELPAFLSRGLSRSDALRVSDVGTAPDADFTATPWGKADRNDDHVLDQAELAGAEAAMRPLDLNGDRIITVDELNAAQAMLPSGDSMTRRSMLESTSVIVVDEPSDDEDDKGVARRQRQLATTLLRFYTFLETVSRDQWPSWSDDQWSELDSNDDQLLDRTEIESIRDVPPHVNLAVRLQDPLAADADNQVVAWLRDPEINRWATGGSGGQLQSPGCVLRLDIEDSFSASNRRVLRNRLEQALSNAQLRAFFVQQLQLDAAAFELVDADQDQRLSDAEFGQVWKWLTVRQGSRLLARWMIADRPWFELADQNGDGRLTEMELSAWPGHLSALDRDADGSLTPAELPLVVRLELLRNDSRLALGPLAAADSGEPVQDADWFDAMDTNRDGILNRSEFIGDRRQFDEADQDQDGFVSRREVASAL